MHWTYRRPAVPRSLGLFAALLMVVPLLLTACGGETATTTPAAATVAGSAVAPTSAASVAATKPANTTAPAAATTAPAAATTATGSAPAAASPAVSSATAPATAASTTDLFGAPLTTKRGEGGTLRLLWWQAPTILNIHTNNGTKDQDAASLVTEPLARISTKAVVPDTPILAKEIPSTQNGLVAADYLSVTWKLKENVTWSDGTPFTAEDVKWTWQYVTNPATGSTNTTLYNDIADVQVLDPTTAKVIFKAPAAAWFIPFVGDAGEIVPKHILSKCPDTKNCEFNTKPVGTGAFVVSDFKSGDTVNYKANEKFREPNAPYFAAVELKGGGDAVTAAKAVQTGQADFAWNLTVAPEVLKQVSDSGKTVATQPGFYVEQLELNTADPRNEVDGELSSAKSKNPFFSDPLVRQAFTYVVDRDSIAKNLWGPGGVAGNTTIPIVRGDIGKPFAYDLKKAGDLLDQAGWKKGADGIREKNGMKMNMSARSSITAQRDKELQVIKQSLKELGINLDLKSVDASVYFGRPDNADSAIRFTTDINLLATGSSKPDAHAFFEGFTIAQLPSKANNWGGSNVNRYQSEEFDKIYDQYKRELSPEKRKAFAVQLDEKIIGEGIRIPLVVRNETYAHRTDLINIQYSAYSSEVWNIGHWALKK